MDARTLLILGLGIILLLLLGFCALPSSQHGSVFGTALADRPERIAKGDLRSSPG
jgi:hypothetical protein